MKDKYFRGIISKINFDKDSGYYGTVLRNCNSGDAIRFEQTSFADDKFDESKIKENAEVRFRIGKKPNFVNIISNDKSLLDDRMAKDMTFVERKNKKENNEKDTVL